MTAAKELMREHNAILSMPGILGHICSIVERGKKDVMLHVLVILECLQTFAHRCHYAKEEQFLFPMAKRCLPREVQRRLSPEFWGMETEILGSATDERFHGPFANIAMMNHV